MLFIEVSDTGIGIDDKKMSTLFKVFRASNSPTQGIGNGLTNSKILVEGLFGNIALSSKINMGTKVTFSIKMNNSFHFKKYVPSRNFKAKTKDGITRQDQLFVETEKAEHDFKDKK